MRRRLARTKRRPPVVEAPESAPPERAELVEPAVSDIDMLVVTSTESGWALMVDDLDVPAWTVSTKKKAVDAAKDAAEDLGCTLVIEKADGSVQKTMNYTEAHA